MIHCLWLSTQQTPVEWLLEIRQPKGYDGKWSRDHPQLTGKKQKPVFCTGALQDDKQLGTGVKRGLGAGDTFQATQ